MFFKTSSNSSHQIVDIFLSKYEVCTLFLIFHIYLYFFIMFNMRICRHFKSNTIKRKKLPWLALNICFQQSKFLNVCTNNQIISYTNLPMLLMILKGEKILHFPSWLSSTDVIIFHLTSSNNNVVQSPTFPPFQIHLPYPLTTCHK